MDKKTAANPTASLTPVLTVFCHEQGHSRIGGNFHQPGFSPDGTGKQVDPHWRSANAVPSTRQEKTAQRIESLFHLAGARIS